MNCSPTVWYLLLQDKICLNFNSDNKQYFSMKEQKVFVIEHRAYMKSSARNHVFVYLRMHASFLFFLILVPGWIETQCKSGQLKALINNLGASAMHMALLPNNKMIIFDHTDFVPSNISLSFGKCWINPNYQVFEIDYWSHSIKYNVENNSFLPLPSQTDTWCSSRVLSLDWCMIETGGFNDEDWYVGTFKSLCDFYNWIEKGIGSEAMVQY